MKIVAWLIVAALLLAGVWWLNRPQPQVVEAVTVAQGDVVVTVVNTRAGTVKSCSRSRLALPLGGVVDKLWVKEGDRVEQGQKLLELWNDDLQAALAQATVDHEHSELARQQSCLQAQFDRRESQRLEKLVKQNLASETNADNARTRAQNSELACAAAKLTQQISQAQVDLAQARIRQTQLYAPFAGVVAEVNGELGEYLTPSPPGVPTPPAIDLLDDHCFYVSAPIDEVDAAKVALQMPVTVSLDALPGQTFAAEVRRIAPYVLDLEKQARTVEVEAELNLTDEAPKLLIGYSADLEIELARAEDVVRIPAEAVTDEGVVYRVRDGVAEPVKPEFGLRNWSWIEVKSGLAAGDWLVRYPGKFDYQPQAQIVATLAAAP